MFLHRPLLTFALLAFPYGAPADTDYSALLDGLDDQAADISQILSIVEGEDAAKALALLGRIDAMGDARLQGAAVDAALRSGLTSAREHALWSVFSNRGELIVEVFGDAGVAIDPSTAVATDTWRFKIYDLDPSRKVGELHDDQVLPVAKRNDTFSISGDVLTFIVTTNSWTASGRLTLSDDGRTLTGTIEGDGDLFSAAIRVR